MKTSKRISVVVPCFNEEGNVEELINRTRPVLDSISENWEMILVDDGSRDQTWSQVVAASSRDGRIKGSRLSRNFGHQFALFAGLCEASGDAVISMDSDLQHPPETIPALVDQWMSGSKIVNTVRIDSEKTGFFKKTTSLLYYKLFSFLSGVEISHGMADFRLLDRQVVERLSEFREEGLFLRGLVQWVGFPTSLVKYRCGDRFSGQTKYNIRRMVKFAWQGVTSFSIVPLRVAILVGLSTALISFVYLSRAVIAHIYSGVTVPGWTSTVGILSFLFGVLFIFLGILGEYIGRILVQVRSRPLFIVAERVGALGSEKTKIQFGKT